MSVLQAKMLLFTLTVVLVATAVLVFLHRQLQRLTRFSWSRTRPASSG
jgi:hypothetical protein